MVVLYMNVHLSAVCYISAHSEILELTTVVSFLLNVKFSFRISIVYLRKFIEGIPSTKIPIA